MSALAFVLILIAAWIDASARARRAAEREED